MLFYFIVFLTYLFFDFVHVQILKCHKWIKYFQHFNHLLTPPNCFFVPHNLCVLFKLSLLYLCAYTAFWIPLVLGFRADHLGLGLFLRNTCHCSSRVETSWNFPHLWWNVDWCALLQFFFFAGNTELVGSLSLSRSYYFLAIFLIPCLLQSFESFVLFSFLFFF